MSIQRVAVPSVLLWLGINTVGAMAQNPGTSALENNVQAGNAIVNEYFGNQGIPGPGAGPVVAPAQDAGPAQPDVVPTQPGFVQDTPSPMPDMGDVSGVVDQIQEKWVEPYKSVQEQIIPGRIYQVSLPGHKLSSVVPTETEVERYKGFVDKVIFYRLEMSSKCVGYGYDGSESFAKALDTFIRVLNVAGPTTKSARSTLRGSRPILWKPRSSEIQEFMVLIYRYLHLKSVSFPDARSKFRTGDSMFISAMENLATIMAVPFRREWYLNYQISHASLASAKGKRWKDHLFAAAEALDTKRDEPCIIEPPPKAQPATPGMP